MDTLAVGPRLNDDNDVYYLNSKIINRHYVRDVQYLPLRDLNYGFISEFIAAGRVQRKRNRRTMNILCREVQRGFGLHCPGLAGD